MRRGGIVGAGFAVASVALIVGTSASLGACQLQSQQCSARCENNMTVVIHGIDPMASPSGSITIAIGTTVTLVDIDPSMTGSCVVAHGEATCWLNGPELKVTTALPPGATDAVVLVDVSVTQGTLSMREAIPVPMTRLGCLEDCFAAATAPVIWLNGV